MRGAIYNGNGDKETGAAERIVSTVRQWAHNLRIGLILHQFHEFSLHDLSATYDPDALGLMG